MTSTMTAVCVMVCVTVTAGMRQTGRSIVLMATCFGAAVHIAKLMIVVTVTHTMSCISDSVVLVVAYSIAVFHAANAVRRSGCATAIVSVCERRYSHQPRHENSYGNDCDYLSHKFILQSF